MASIVNISDVVFEWPGRDAFRLSTPSFQVDAGEHVALVGPSGGGKTSLINLIAGVSKPKSGRIEVCGVDLGALSSGGRDRFRADHIGLIFQLFNLLPYASVLQNVVLPLAFSKIRRHGVGAPEQEARRLLEALEVPPELARAPVTQLSVGQQQRVAAARALIGEPELILADEPTSALDAPTRDRFLDLLFAEAERSGAAILVVTHDAAVAKRFSRIVPLEEIATSKRGSPQ